MISLNVNQKTYQLDVDPDMPLLWAIRDFIGLTGTKYGCGVAQCGACVVHLNGEAVRSCVTKVKRAEGQKITTIEGLAKDDELHPMQEAFIEYDGFQCGYCTPGQIMSAIACIKEGHADNEDEIREFMSGNICRCGAYPNIVDAIVDVKKGGRPGSPTPFIFPSPVRINTSTSGTSLMRGNGLS